MLFHGPIKCQWANSVPIGPPLPIYPPESPALTRSTSAGDPWPMGHLLILDQGQVFSVPALAWWNMLPVENWALRDLLQFLRTCKIELFRQAFGYDGICLSTISLPCLHLIADVYRIQLQPSAWT